MAYAKTEWNNDGPPPIDRVRLNKIEQGISDGHDLAEAAQLGVDDLRGRFITAGGPPEGLVAAEPGSKYIDQVGTNGAWEWIKRTGDGVTGWEVSYGDTGWRRVTDYDAAGNLVSGQPLGAGWEKIPTGPNCRVDLRRFGPRVTAVVSFVRAAVDDPASRIHTVAAGFSPAIGTSPAFGFSGGKMFPLYARLDRPGSFTMLTGFSINFFEVAYSTSDPWPTTLPGVAV